MLEERTTQTHHLNNENLLAAAVSDASSSIADIGATWMLHPEQFEASIAAGYPHPFAGYFAGRAGVLGEVDTHIVDAAIVIFAPDVVDAMWTSGRPVHGARGGAEIYTIQAAEWARKRFDGLEGLPRFVELGEKVLAVAPAANLPLFAGWRALPRVADSPGRAMQVLLILRELRCGIHLAALTAAGITPVEANMLNKGEEYCALLGWTAPLPAVEHLRSRRAEVEQTTNDRVSRIFASALTLAEIEELAQITTAMNTRSSL
ncbi:SCO6745 family protein [Rhodococcus jostii]|uniref:EvbL n=1 Tax=Rhodococcus jostii TaxID=132919 RepID=A0ABU4CTK9_RHOJO|nr:evbL [Rhodococcus jostii]MDV6286622.1 evbL [Rhodococcus jostii]